MSRTTSHRRISLADVEAGRIPEDLQGVRWPDGTVECRYNISAADYLDRRVAEAKTDPGTGEVLRGDPVDCDRCASKCGPS